MKKYEKEVLQAYLNEEKRVLAELEDNYAIALHDILLRLENLLGRNDADLPHVIYQIEYQKALKTQVQAILEQLQVNEFETISDYLTRCYNTGFIGSMYSFHKQGLPFLIPIDQKQVVDAIRHKTKLKQKLYDELGVDIKKLQKTIAGEISRGISTGLGYGDMARNISLHGRIPLNRAMVIARTESHRIQCQATSDAQYKAKEKGADVLKQWDAALDGATRPNHRKLDGQIRELDEPFEVAGMKAMFPGDFGKASEDCNCRCAILQRARWALDEEELEELKKRAEYHGLDKTKDFEDFQKKYLKASEQVRDSGQKINDEDTSQEKAEESIEEEYNRNEEAIKKTLYEVEESRRDLVHEVGTIINRKGEIINVTGGEDHGVDVPEELLKDNIFTHNHPSGGCFTSSDINEAIKTELYELRASTPQGTYFSLKRNGKPIDDSIVSEYADVASFIKADEAIAADYKKGIITRKEMEEKGYQLYVEYQSKAAQAWLKENAEKYGFTYESGKIDKLLENLENTGKNGIIKVEKNKLVAGKYAVSKEMIADILNNELNGINLSMKPVYNSRIRSQGKITATEDALKRVTIKSFEIGKQVKDTKECLIDSILHEELEARILLRKKNSAYYSKIYNSGDDGIHDHINAVIKRYFKAKGWNYDMV